MSEQGLVRYAQPVHVTLTRSAKGSYYWEVSIHAPTIEETMDMIREADRRLRNEYHDEAPG